MKKRLLMCAVMSGLLLAGCAAQQPQASAPAQSQSVPEGGVMTLAELREKNALEEVLEQHSAMSYITTYMDETGTTWGETMGQFTLADGQLLYERIATQYDQVVEYADGYEAQDVPGAFYLTDGYSKLMFLYPEGEYDARMALDWSNAAGFESEDPQEVLSSEIVGEDIVLKLQSLSAEAFEESVYYADAETGLIHTIEVSVYDGTGSLYASTSTKVLYDKPYATQDEAYKMIAGGEDAVELTVVFAPGEAGEYTQTLRAAGDTRVILSAKQEYTLYADAALTQPLESIDLIGGNTTVYAGLK